MKIDKIIYTKNKNISLSIDQNANVILKIPKKANSISVERFILSKENWIIKHKTKQLKVIEKYQNLINYSSILLYGKEYKIRFDENTKNILRLNDEIIFPQKNKEKIEKYIKTYLTKLAEQVLEQRIIYFSKITGINFNEFKTSNAKQKWGSCDSKKRIKLSFRLIMLKPDLIDYVILHELCHIKEMNHSYSFWKLVSSFNPNWESLRKELKSESIISNLY